MTILLTQVTITCGISFGASDNPRETPVVKVVRENAEAVVNISTERIVYLRENPFWGSYGSELDYLFDQFFGMHTRTHALKLKSVGSGVIVDQKGVIVTNAHVVNMANKVFIVFNDGSSVEGLVKYEKPEDDLAIIQINPPKTLHAVKLGRADDIIVGESVVAIGNPFGLENSVSAGIISGKNRDIFGRGNVALEGLLQTDAPINPGNSGGALLNLDGDLIGINVAVVQNAQSVGFAMPVDRVKEVIQEFERNRNVTIKHRGRTSPPRIAPGVGRSTPRHPEPWDPFSEMDRVHEEMRRMFQGTFGERGQGGMGIFDSNLAFDSDFEISETDTEYIIKFDVAGLKQKNVKIEISERSLTISGERSEEVNREKRQGTSYRSKSYSSFLRTIPLPEDGDTQAIETETEGDTIVIRIPKRR